MAIKYDDFPIADCARQAQPLIKKGVTVHQKWTCGHCGSRQSMGDANTFYASGKCEECEQITMITHCNYLAIYNRK